MPERRKTVSRKLACVCLVLLFAAVLPTAAGRSVSQPASAMNASDGPGASLQLGPLGLQLNFGSPGIGAFVTDNRSVGNIGVNTTIVTPSGASLTDTQADILGAFDSTNSTAFAGVGFAIAGSIIGAVETPIAYFPNGSYAYSTSNLLSAGTAYTFDMFHYRGYWWNYTEDGSPITGSSSWENGTYNLGVSTAQGVVMQSGVPSGPYFLGILNRTSNSGAYPTLPTTTVKFAIGVRMPGSTSYVAPLSANAMPQLNASLGVAGIDGHAQSPSLHNNQLTLGSSIKYVGMGTPLWGNYILKVLTSVGLTPTSPTITAGQSQVFVAQAMNQTGFPMSGPRYSWQVSPASLGTLNSTSGKTVTFNAGQTPGTGKVWVNSTYNGTVVSNSTAITVKTAPITLSSVSITPTSSTVNTTGSQSFNAVPVCKGGSCPSTVTYSWGLTNALGSLNSTTARTVTFTAGSQVGSAGLFVNASLDGLTQGAGPASITINLPPPPLASVTVAPSSASVSELGTANFTATPFCTQTCPSGATYSWSLTNGAIGTISSTPGNTVQFTAGDAAGTAALFVNATLGGVTKEGNPVPITVTLHPTLSSVSVTPTTSIIKSESSTGPITATPTCTATCPAGTTYSWTLSKQTLGQLSSSSGDPVTFDAGKVSGTVTLFANATLDGLTVMGNPVSIIVTSPLASVSVSPTSASVAAGGTTPDLVASPSCTGTCPSGTNYAWTLTDPSLGHLNASSGSSVEFTAGSSAGSLALFVNATLDGATEMSAPVPITISSSAPTLLSLAITPAATSLAQGGTGEFTATPTCSETCPSSISYSWAQTDSALGSLSSTTGSSVSFTAADLPGTVSLFVNGTLSGLTLQSNAATINIAANTQSIASVSVTASSSNVQVSGSVVLTASPSCTSGACPSSVTYSWILTNKLGSLSSYSDPSATFTAGNSVGSVTVYVNATLGGTTVTSFVTINITQQSSGTTSSGSSGDGTMILVAAVLVVVAAGCVAGIMMMHRRRRVSPADPAQPPAV